MNSRSERRVGSAAHAGFLPPVRWTVDSDAGILAVLTWHEAKAIAAEWERVGSWNGEIRPPISIPEDPKWPHVSIERAVKEFLEELRETAAVATHKKYRLLLNRFKKFSEGRGYVMIDQWEPSDVRQFRSTWPVSAPTAVRRMAMMKPFFEYCVSNQWITRNPARMVKNPKGRDVTDGRNEQKLPFSDDEIQKMYDACREYGITYRHKWKGDDMADFHIAVHLHGPPDFRYGALFHIDRMQPSGEILIRTSKAGTHVYTWIPEWLQERIRERAKKYRRLIFGAHQTKSLDVITDVWRRKLNRVWELCGPWKEKPTPHRFRHTFARILLQKPGVTVRDVAELLGNTEEMVRKRYSAWVPERQARLTKILKEAFEDKPKPRVVSIR